MNKFLTVFFLLFVIHAFSQTDKNGNPVVNSVTLKEDTIKNFQLLSNYYTLKNNIDSKTSSVYISDKPSLDEIETAAISLPSDFFVITKNQSMLNIILLRNNPSRSFLVINPATGEQKEYPCKIPGDISENRANEIIKENYDPKAKIKDDTLFFNNEALTITFNKDIKENVLNFIERQRLSASDTLNVKILSKEELKKIVLSESKEGGKFDFFTEIKGHEYDGIQIKPGIFTTNLGIALYKWGRANFDLGVNNVDDALEFWAEFKDRPADQRERVYITKGFNKELEK